MVKQYFFILGRNPDLSLAELHAVLPRDYKVLSCSTETLVVECQELEVEKLMKRLGGTIKVGIILHTIRHFDRAAGEWRNLTPYLWPVVRSLDFARDDASRQKFFLGLSAYALDNQARLPNVRELREMGMQLKRALQTPSESPPWPGGEKRSVRLVTSRERALSAVIVKKEKLLTQGMELVLFYRSAAPGVPPLRDIKSRATFGGEMLIGKTLAVQEFEEASQRDFGRPVREMKVGMLPIQLAKIMINLARAPLDATLLDPFCGLGTILAEAWLMGHRNLIGSDLEQRMIDATRKNLDWLFCDSRESQNSHVQLLTSPVEQLSKHLPSHSMDAIVTEPYLGPIRRIKNQESRIMGELVLLYSAAFREFSKILKPGGRVVFIFPAFVTKRQAPSLSDETTKTSTAILPKITTFGFQPIQLLPKTYNLKPATSILYSRPDQRVLREIFVLEFKPQT